MFTEWTWQSSLSCVCDAFRSQILCLAQWISSCRQPAKQTKWCQTRIFLVFITFVRFFFFFFPGFRIAAAFCRCAISFTFNSLNRPECTEARNMSSFENELQGSQSSFGDLKILGYLIKKLKGWAKLACVHKKMRNFNYPSQDVFWYETSYHLADNFVAFTTYS